MEQSAKGMIDDVPEKMLPAGGVPHHAVIRRDKETTKLRIVFDASSKTEGVSLNGCLNSGPCFVSNLSDVLLGCLDFGYREGFFASRHTPVAS